MYLVYIYNIFKIMYLVFKNKKHCFAWEMHLYFWITLYLLCTIRNKRNGFTISLEQNTCGK